MPSLSHEAVSFSVEVEIQTLTFTSVFTARPPPHLLRGEIPVSSCEELSQERLYGPHHGAEAVDTQQRGGAHPSSAAGQIMATLPDAAGSHRSSLGSPGGPRSVQRRAESNSGSLIW